MCLVALMSSEVRVFRHKFVYVNMTVQLFTASRDYKMWLCLISVIFWFCLLLILNSFLPYHSVLLAISTVADFI